MEQRTGQRVCHAKIAEVARAAAGHLYETMMGNNTVREMWLKQNPGVDTKQLEKLFIDRNWVHCIDFARTTITLMLTKDDVSEKCKEEIMDILQKDQSIRGKYVAHTPLTKPN